MKQPLFSTEKPLILDGAVGTELAHYGVDIANPIWSAVVLQQDPELLTKIHLRYITAGADIITANTFRTNAYSLQRADLAHKASYYTTLAVQCAKDARTQSGKKVLIAGSMGPLGDCYSPNEVPSDSTLKSEHLQHAHTLCEAGVDLLLLETMNNIREATIALRCAKKCCDTVIVSLVCKDGKLLSGERLSEAIRALERFHPAAILLNCMTPPDSSEGVKMLRAFCKVPYGAYANGKMVTRHWDDAPRIHPDEFVQFVDQWVSDGASVVGGCCGTAPEHIVAIHARLRG